jgi:hypothetical protein
MDAASAPGLRRADVGYSTSAVQAAVEAGLLECPLPGVPAEPDFPDLVTFWLLDLKAREWFPPPRTSDAIAAIDRRLLASAN